MKLLQKKNGHQEFWVEKWIFLSKKGPSEICVEKSQDTVAKLFLVPQGQVSAHVWILNNGSLRYISFSRSDFYNIVNC